MWLYMSNHIIFKSLYDWCVENNRKDILEFWDYELNDKSPKEIGYSSNKKYWFKCKRHLHESYKKYLKTMRDGVLQHSEDYFCPKCNSVGQYIIDKMGQEHLDKVWSSKNTLSPFDISKSSAKGIWLKCLKDDTHPDYYQSCYNYIKDIGCPYCSGKSVCFTNSLGYRYPEIIGKWSDKNEKTPYDYTYGSNQFAWFKCENGMHDDYQRKICAEISYEMVCTACGKENQEYNGGSSLKEPEDLTGMKFGRLTAIRYIRKGKRNSVY